MTIPADLITGLVVCGGRGTRMGGVDKGLQNYNGMPLALHALMRLSPQVGHLMINANRNLAAYESLGAPVWPDPVGDFAGPLAGWQAGLIADTILMSAATPCTFALLLLIVDSRIRAFGAAVYLLIFSLVGQSIGSVAVGLLNDWLAPEFREGAIRISMTLSPWAIGMTGILLFILSRKLAPAD